MKAMVFAAGLGTRLKPLTNNKPKALVEVQGRPLLSIALERLAAAGFTEIIINTHHFSNQVIDFISKTRIKGVQLTVSDESEKLLDTGGGLKKASSFFSDDKPFLLCNADILSNIDLRKFYEKHLASGALATLAVRKRKTSRCFLFDDNFHLRGWRNTQTGETKWCNEKDRVNEPRVQEWAFSGIQALNPDIFNYMPGKDVFSIIDVYLNVAAQNSVKAYPHDEDLWFDVGTPESLAKAEHLYFWQFPDSYRD